MISFNREKVSETLGCFVLLCVILIVILCSWGAVQSDDSDAKLSELYDEMNSQKDLKMDCLDNLSYLDSVNEALGVSKNCVMYDEEIMSLQAQIDELEDSMVSEYEVVDSFGLTGDVEAYLEMYLSGDTVEYSWEPGMLNDSGDAQVMPSITGSDEHEKFKALASAYGLDAGQIWEVENHYGIREGVILCITVAETSGGNRGYGEANIGSVGSNDRGDRPTYALMESGLEAIGKTLSNQYLGSKKTLGCLSNGGSCVESGDNGKRYATSDGNWERNMVSCLSSIYGSVDPSSFSIRR